MAESLCRMCGRRFGGTAGFDWHLRYLEVAPWVECRDPADIAGLSDRGDGVWVRATPAKMVEVA